MPAAFDPNQLNRSEQSAGNGGPDTKWSGDDSNYDTNWGGDYDSDKLKKGEGAAAKPVHEDAFPGGYTEGSGEHESSFRSRIFRGRRRKTAIGAAIVALIAAAVISIIIGILPLKILHIVNNLQARFYATAENAVEKETERLFSNYALGKMLAGCRNDVIDHNCNPYNNKTLVTRLYRGWSDGRLEEKLKKQTGMEMRKVGGRYYMRFNANDQIDLSDLRNNKTIAQIIDAKGDWTQVKKSQVKGVYKSSLKAVTKHASTMYYVKVTPLLARKFGIKWCVIGCDKKDTYQEWKGDKKFGAKMWLAERVLGPRAEMYRMIMECIYSPGSCDKDKVLDYTRSEYSATAEGCQKGCDGDNGRAKSTKLTEMEAKLVALASQSGSSYTKLRAAFDTFEKRGFISQLLNSWANTKVDDTGDSKGKSALQEDDAVDKVEAEGQSRGLARSAVRTLGWVYLAASIADFVDELPQIVASMQYTANSAAMAQVWSMYRTVADEGKEGETDAELYGSFVTSLSPGLQPVDGESGDEQAGGTAGAEGSPLYPMLVSAGPSASAGIGVSKFAASKDYVCKGGEPPAADEGICKEEQLAPTGDGDCNLSWLVCKFEDVKKVPGWGLIAQASDFLTDTVNGLVSDIIGSIISSIPFLDDLLGWVSDLVGNLVQWTRLGDVFKALASWMLGVNLNMVSNNNGGARTFNLAAGGANASASAFNHNGLGGVALTPDQEQANLDYYQEKQLAEYRQQSFFAQLTDTKSPYSPAARLALAMPSNTTAVSNGLNNAWASFISNPFGKFMDTFASMFSTRAGASGFVPGKDPFGITQYGYPLDDPIFNEDPDQYWQKYCTDESPFNLTNAWNDYAAEHLDSATFQPENLQTAEFQSQVPGNKYGTNGCLLIQTAVGSAGAIFTDDVLSSEELAVLVPDNAGGAGGGSGGTCETTSEANTPPDNYKDLIARYAPNRDQPGVCPTPARAFPNDPNKQFFGQMANNNGEKRYLSSQDDPRKGGYSITWKGPGDYIAVKYRNPPIGSNTVWIPTF